MDRDAIRMLIPIMALAIPVVAVVFHGLQRVMKLRIEEARARAGAVDDGAAAALEALHADVAQLRQELGEVQERLDFTERALTQGRDRQASRLEG